MRLFISLILLLSFGCGTAEQEETTSAPEPNRTFHFVSDNGTANFYLTVIGTDSVELQIGDDSETLLLIRTIAASGEKYQTEDSLYFWTKGSTFIYGKADSIFVSGQEAVR